MSIPLYFAMNQDETQKYPAQRRAQLGYGFQINGKPVIPSRLIPGAPAVINDMVLPEEAPEVDELAERCEMGCILDFERKITPVHIAILQELEKRLPKTSILVIPTALLPYSSMGIPLICPEIQKNSWKNFCIMQKQAYSRWFWEVIPWNLTRSFPIKGGSKGVLTGAQCCYERNRRIVRYFDTEETIESKLRTAEEQDCIGAVGLAMELSQLKKHPPEE